MDIHKRIYGALAIADKTEITGLDLPELLRRLLLFEGVVVYSRFAELGMMTKTHGLDATLALITAPGFELVSDPATIVRRGKHVVGRTQNGLLRVSQLDFGILRAARPDEWTDTSFANLRKISELTRGRANKLENTIRGHLKPIDLAAREVPFEQSKLDFLTVGPTVRRAVDLALGKHGRTLPPAGTYLLKIEHCATGYEVETDLHRLLKLSDDHTGAVIAAGLLGAAGLNCVIDDMRVHNALVGLQESELAVLEAKLDFLMLELDPKLQARRLERVVALANLPSISDPERLDAINIHRLLDVRQTAECRAFRDWLWSADKVTDEEVHRQFHALRQQLGALIRTDRGKGIRWAISTGIGFIPIVGAMIGAAGGLLDTFLTERLLPSRGALTFLGAQYQSIFDR